MWYKKLLIFRLTIFGLFSLSFIQKIASTCLACLYLSPSPSLYLTKWLRIQIIILWFWDTDYCDYFVLRLCLPVLRFYFWLFTQGIILASTQGAYTTTCTTSIYIFYSGYIYHAIYWIRFEYVQVKCFTLSIIFLIDYFNYLERFLGKLSSLDVLSTFQVTVDDGLTKSFINPRNRSPSLMGFLTILLAFLYNFLNILPATMLHNLGFHYRNTLHPRTLFCS